MDKLEFINKLEEIGGNRWQRFGKDRVYLSSAIPKLINLEIERYKTGNISSAKIDNVEISNSEGGRILEYIDKIYYDVEIDKLVIQNKKSSMEWLEDLIKDKLGEIKNNC